jgi:hypothetical protein
MIERINGTVELGVHIVIVHRIDVPVIFWIDIRVLFRIQCAVECRAQIKINLRVVPVFEALGKSTMEHQQTREREE